MSDWSDPLTIFSGFPSTEGKDKNYDTLRRYSMGVATCLQKRYLDEERKTKMYSNIFYAVVCLLFGLVVGIGIALIWPRIEDVRAIERVTDQYLSPFVNDTLAAPPFTKYHLGNHLVWVACSSSDCEQEPCLKTIFAGNTTALRHFCGVVKLRSCGRGCHITPQCETVWMGGRGSCPGEPLDDWSYGSWVAIALEPDSDIVSTSV